MVERNRDKCRGGFWMCAEAARLWNVVGMRYNEAAGNPPDHHSWLTYDLTLALFNAHQPHNDDTSAPALVKCPEHKDCYGWPHVSGEGAAKGENA